MSRAMISIRRNFSRTILLFSIVLLLTTTMGVAILANGAISQTETNMLRRMLPIVTVRSDVRAWTSYDVWEDWEGDISHAVFDPRLSAENVRSIGSLQVVSEYEYIIRTYLHSFSLENIDDGIVQFPQPGMPNSFTLLGVSRNDFTQAEQGLIEIVEGRNFTTEDFKLSSDIPVAIISEEFAYINGLSLGSHFELSSFTHYPLEATATEDDMFNHGAFVEEFIFERIPISFKIIGLFDITIDEAYSESTGFGSAHQHRLSNLGNIYVTTSSLEEHFDHVNDSALAARNAMDTEISLLPHEPVVLYPIPIFILENPLYLQDFYELAEPLLPDFHQFVDLSRSFENVSTSLVTINNIADWIMRISFVATVLIFSLCIILILRNQRHQIGILLALGERKIKVFIQFFMEVLIISFFGVTLALLLGNFISDTVFTNLMRNELISLDEQSETQFQTGGYNLLDGIGIPSIRMSPEQLIESFNTSLSFETIILFYSVTLGVVLLSITVALSFVLKLNVGKILLYEKAN